jgi:hypothetical protein
MYLASVYLYPNTIDVFTNSLVSSQERFRKVYNRNLKIYRSTDNRIEVRVKNGDQRAANIGDNALVFTLVALDTQKLVLKKDCVVRDGQLGIGFVDLTKDDLLKLEEGFYQYNLSLETRDIVESGQHDYLVTAKKPLYVDSQFAAISNVEVVGDLDGEFRPSVEILEFTYVNPIGLGEPESTFFFSSIMDASPLTSTPQSLHTFQMYFTDYTGRVDIEASLDPQGATPKTWTVVKTFEFEDETTGTVYENVQGKYNWFRVRHFPTNVSLPRDGPINVFGTLDKILYR